MTKAERESALALCTEAEKALATYRTKLVKDANECLALYRKLFSGKSSTAHPARSADCYWVGLHSCAPAESITLVRKTQ